VSFKKRTWGTNTGSSGSQPMVFGAMIHRDEAFDAIFTQYMKIQNTTAATGPETPWRCLPSLSHTHTHTHTGMVSLCAILRQPVPNESLVSCQNTDHCSQCRHPPHPPPPCSTSKSINAHSLVISSFIITSIFKLSFTLKALQGHNPSFFTCEAFIVKDELWRHFCVVEAAG